MTTFSDFVPDPGERNLVYGTSRSGKSSYIDMIMRAIQRTRPDCMVLVADTKPRFRADKEQHHWTKTADIERFAYTNRRPAAYRYKEWSAGPVVPNSVVVDIHADHPFRGLWDTERHPGEIAIMQGEKLKDWVRMLWLMDHFVERKTKRERLIVVDEGLDFYQRNTLGIDTKNDVILRTARAGGERGIGLLFGAHRPHGVPPLLNTLASRLTLFHLRYSRDMSYLWEMGVPMTEHSPEGDYIFRHYTVRPGGRMSTPITAKLKLDDSYLSQLSAS